MNENNSLETAKEFLYSLKADTADITDSGIEEVNLLRGQSLKTDNFSQMKLPINLVNKLCSKKIDKASLVQKNVIPFILEGNPVSVQSRSGTGKTIAYTVGTLPKIVGDRSVQCLVITPNKVLSRQISDEMAFFADSLELKVSHPVTWADYVHNTAEIVVGCPGTLLNLIDNFLNVQIIILDESDLLLDPIKMGQETILILKLIPNAQRLYFSATYSPKIKEIINNIEKGNFLAEFRSIMERRLSYQTKLLLNNLSKQSKLILPNQHNKKELITFYEAKNDKPEEIKLFHTFVPENEKTNFLLQLYNLLPMSQSIIFVSKRSTVESLKKVFEDDLYQVSFLHGDMNEECKRKFVDEFSQGKTKILITTDIFSRGLDIPLVNAIINFDLPMNRNEGMVDTYIHRIGRSGRFGRKGFVLDFCASDVDFQAVKNFSAKLSFENKFFYMTDLEIAWKEIESSNFY